MGWPQPPVPRLQSTVRSASAEAQQVMITKDTPIHRHLIAVDAPVGSVFTVYAEDPGNRIRFQQNIVQVIPAPDPVQACISYGLCATCRFVHDGQEPCPR